MHVHLSISMVLKNKDKFNILGQINPKDGFYTLCYFSGEESALQGKFNIKKNQKMKTRLVNVRRLKSFAIDNLPHESPLREVMLYENDELDALTFLARLPVWLRLSTLRQGEKR